MTELEIYRNLVNRIDDYLEYAYKESTTDEVRDKILSMIDDASEEFNELHP